MNKKDISLLEEAYNKILIKEADIERLAQQDPREIYGDEPDTDVQADPEALRAHIAKKNAAIKAWVDEKEGRWATYHVEDPEFWNKDGIYTPEQYDHYNLVADVFETTRDVLGYKPHWGQLYKMSDEELRAELDYLYRQARAEREEEEKEEASFKQGRDEAKKPIDNSMANAFDKALKRESFENSPQENAGGTDELLLAAYRLIQSAQRNASNGWPITKQEREDTEKFADQVIRRVGIHRFRAATEGGEE